MPCRPGLCTHAADCRDVLCPGHPAGAGYAENTYLHLRKPAPIYDPTPLPVDYCGDEPLSDTATACVIAFIVTVFLACTAAVIWNLLPLMQWAAN
jgi:hypothetical protein